MKKDKFISFLKDREVFVISPHLDDAVLSTGMLLYKLRNHKNTTVVNCFTKAHKGPYTLSAAKFLRDTGRYTDATELYKARLKEDKNALSSLNVKIINLGFEDGLFRRREQKNFLLNIIPELRHLYPTYRWHIIKKINTQDYALRILKKSLEKFKANSPIVFAPYGIGNHVDHVVTRKACEEIFPNTIFYSDFPYNIRLNNFGSPQKKYIRYKLPVDLKIKSKLAGYYTSQINLLLKNGILPKHQEVFFVPENLLK